jgi:transposase-like protein
MPLSAILLNVEMAFECPLCGHALVKRGSWFQTIGRFQCRGCQDPVRLSYKDKLALFERHAHLGFPR